MDFETIIGLEIHVELSTASKMFCGCSTGFGGTPNSRVCPVCLGLPGSLPVPNRKAVSDSILLGLALSCRVSPTSIFHRKNYFYPDMPKNFQVSQYDIPLSSGGFMEVEMDDYVRRVGITRVHLEEDTGKSIHVGESGRIHGSLHSMEDYNRAGIPLAEIVTEPDLRSPAEARAFMQLLKSTLEYLDISDCRMEEGSLRCDANISLACNGRFGTKVEIKNMNSFRALHQALVFEEKRQRVLMEAHEQVMQETRHWDESAGRTQALRSKEEAFDYRYFPEPDLVPVSPEPEMLLELESTLPELPLARRRRFRDDYCLPADTALVLAADRHVADYFEEAARACDQPIQTANWITGDLAALVADAGIPVEACRVPPSGLAGLVQLVSRGTISGKMAKEVLREAFNTGESPQGIVESRGLSQIDDEGELDSTVARVISMNPEAVRDYESGKEQALKFLMGKVMKETRGKANPGMAAKILRKQLGR